MRRATALFFLERGHCNGLHHSVCPSICPLCCLHLNHWTRFNQIWCVSNALKCGVQQHFLAPPPGEGSKGQLSLIFNYKVNFKYFIPNFVCVLTNKRYKTYQTAMTFCYYLDHARRAGLWGQKLTLYVCPLCYILLTHLTKTNQFRFVSFSHE